VGYSRFGRAGERLLWGGGDAASSFDKLRMRPNEGAVESLILSLSKDEAFGLASLDRP
jgi:hypothetical protein